MLSYLTRLHLLVKSLVTQRSSMLSLFVKIVPFVPSPAQTTIPSISTMAFHTNSISLLRIILVLCNVFAFLHLEIILCRRVWIKRYYCIFGLRGNISCREATLKKKTRNKKKQGGDKSEETRCDHLHTQSHYSILLPEFHLHSLSHTIFSYPLSPTSHSPPPP